jgi:glycosyltransferase involved in cell wall biosynthesis
VENGRPIAGYYGALAKWFDYRLLKSVAVLLPNWYFILIGLDYDGSVNRSRVLEYPNILWLGSKPYEKIPSYLKYFDVATIPFRLNEITHATSPLKLYEYMAAGKPIVTTAMNECQKYPPVLIAKDANDFALKLENSLSMRSDQAYQNSLCEWAEKNTWEQRAAQILSAVTAHSENADD